MTTATIRSTELTGTTFAGNSMLDSWWNSLNTLRARYSGTTTVSLDANLNVVVVGRNADVTGTLPANTSAPIITDTQANANPALNDTLQCSTGVWTQTPTSYTYQWFTGGTTPIAGATGQVYKVTAGDSGNALTCKVTPSNLYGAGPATASNALTCA